jgi:hypothetical protein
MACAFTAEPKSSPAVGMPPIAPGSAVSVRKSMMCSSAATLATPSGMPIPRFTTLLGRSSMAARRAMTLRSVSCIAAIELRTRRSSPLNAGEYCVPKVCQ